ncbi:MAG: DUF7681 family protein, partial [Sphaerochaetaceae bacterium]
KAKIEAIRFVVKSAAQVIENSCPEGRGKEYAAKALEECLMWANKSICGNDGTLVRTTTVEFRAGMTYDDIMRKSLYEALGVVLKEVADGEGRCI